MGSRISESTPSIFIGRWKILWPPLSRNSGKIPSQILVHFKLYWTLLDLFYIVSSCRHAQIPGGPILTVDTGTCRPVLYDPLFTPSCPDCSLRPPSFKFFETVLSPEITNFWKICISEPQNRWKVESLRQELSQISVPRALDKKISSLRGYCTPTRN